MEFEVPHPLLVCTYTNVAVDNLVDGLANAGVKPLRVGYSGNVRQSLLKHTLDYKLTQHPLHPTLATLVEDSANIVVKIDDLWKRSKALWLKIKEMEKPGKSMLTRAHNMKQALVALQLRQKMLKSKIYAMQQQMLQDVVADADVVSVELTFFFFFFLTWDDVDEGTASFLLGLHDVYYHSL